MDLTPTLITDNLKSNLRIHEAEIPNHGKQFDICFIDPVRDP